MASNAKTLLQHPPKINPSINPTASHDGSVSTAIDLSVDIMVRECAGAFSASLPIGFSISLVATYESIEVFLVLLSCSPISLPFLSLIPEATSLLFPIDFLCPAAHAVTMEPVVLIGWTSALLFFPSERFFLDIVADIQKRKPIST